MNPIVEVVAERLHQAEAIARRANGDLWRLLSDARRQALRERVECVLLAALNAGYVLSTLTPEGREADLAFRLREAKTALSATVGALDALLTIPDDDPERGRVRLRAGDVLARARAALSAAETPGVGLTTTKMRGSDETA